MVMILVFPDLTYQNNIFFKCLPVWFMGCYLGKKYKHDGSAAYQTFFPSGKGTLLAFLGGTTLYVAYVCITHESGTPVAGLFGFLYAFLFVYTTMHVSSYLFAEKRSNVISGIAKYTYYIFLDHCLFVILANAIFSTEGISYYFVRIFFVFSLSFFFIVLLSRALKKKEHTFAYVCP